jgi:hypothetical protein
MNPPVIALFYKGCKGWFSKIPENSPDTPGLGGGWGATKTTYRSQTRGMEAADWFMGKVKVTVTKEKVTLTKGKSDSHKR